MSEAGIVAMLLGALVVCGRGALLLAPEATLKWFKGLIITEGRVRMLGMFSLLLGGVMMWPVWGDDGTLATVLFVFGVLAAMVAIPVLILFPKLYKGMADTLIAHDSGDNLFRWRMLGLAGVIVGVALFLAGKAAVEM